MSKTSLPTLPVAADQFLLRPGISFLNHGSFGACPRPVFDTYQGWQRKLEEQPVEFAAQVASGKDDVGGGRRAVDAAHPRRRTDSS